MEHTMDRDWQPQLVRHREDYISHEEALRQWDEAYEHRLENEQRELDAWTQLQLVRLRRKAALQLAALADIRGTHAGELRHKTEFYVEVRRIFHRGVIAIRPNFDRGWQIMTMERPGLDTDAWDDLVGPEALRSLELLVRAKPEAILEGFTRWQLEHSPD